MSDHYLDNLLPDFGEYSLESVLESYRKRGAASGDKPSGEKPSPDQPVRTAEAIAQRSRQIVMEALGETLSQRREAEKAASQAKEHDIFDDLADLLGDDEDEDAPAQAPAPAEKKHDIFDDLADLLGDDEEDGAEAASPAEGGEGPKKPRIHISPDGVITMDIDLPQPEPEEKEAPYEEEPEEETRPRRPVRDDRDRARAQARPAQEEPASAADRFLMPLVRMAATRMARRQMQKAEAANWPDPVDIRETEEMEPRRASKFYGQQLRPLRFRLRVCVFLCIVLAWISLRLPMAGILGSSIIVQSGVSLLLLATVMMCTLDILAAGLRQLFDLHPGAESLAVLAAVLSAIDALTVMRGGGTNLPFCAVGAFSLAAALWGEKLDCTARARTMRMAAISKNPSALTAEETGKGVKYLSRTVRPAAGVVRRTEQPDFCQTVYATAAPLLLGASLLLAALASMNGQWVYFLHNLSAMLAVSASFTAFLSFPLPYSMTARKLQASGAAIAGYAGCAEIGRIRRLVLSDGDLFPPGTMKLSGINILEGAKVERVVACTASLLAASGSGVAGVFMELIERRGYSLVETEEFRCHEGGGLSARVNGEQVLVGSAGVMNLMGIRLPQNMAVKNAVCTALSGELVGVFTLEYIPVTSVQEALVTLLQGRTQPIFAIRDFNITPLMIRQLFRVPTDSFSFPSFRERYSMAASASADSPTAAVLSRTGMGPLVDAAESGRKLYSSCRTGTVLSLAGTVIGLVTMFLLCRAGSYDTATVGNVLSYMVLWALPALILAFGQSR